MLAFNHLGQLGRLGNQMFQYAALRGIADKHGYEWCIPPSNFQVEPKAGEEKDHQLLEAFELRSLKETKLLGAPYIEEKSFTFDEDLFENCKDNINLYGFFQTPKYFNHIADSIKEDFTFRSDILNPCKEIFSFNTKTISLHIRRSDYVQKQDYHPLLTLNYYEEALSNFEENTQVIIFSDDPKWCKTQPLFDSDRFLISESNNNMVDMCLMTLCDYHIIANSSFSWWGAWLANSKKVIAPKVWFGPAANLDDRDLVPEEWERI